MLRYGKSMIEHSSPLADRDSMEQELGDALARADKAAESIVPILRHVLSNEDNSLFGDEIIARIKGMARHLAVQLLDRRQGSGDGRVAAEHTNECVAHLCDLLVENEALVAHLHALALETQLSERLHARFGTDAVLTPLLQAQIASSDPDLASLAMRFLAAQARHSQSQRRMKLPLLELPGDHLHHALLSLRSLEFGGDPEACERAAQAVRRDYREASTRLGLASLLLARMGPGAVDALSINHAGVVLFATALAMGAGMDRDAAILATHETQAARFALALRSAGTKVSSVREQCLALHPDLDFPEQFETIGPDRAAALLAAGSGLAGY